MAAFSESEVTTTLLRATVKLSLAGQPYFSYVHACAYDKWAGESARKNTSGHSRQVFVSQPGMLG